MRAKTAKKLIKKDLMEAKATLYQKKVEFEEINAQSTRMNEIVHAMEEEVKKVQSWRWMG